MNLSEINWDINAAGTWPPPVKAAVIAIISLAVAGGWFYLDTQGQLNELEAAQAKEVELKRDFEAKQRKAANLQDYEFQLTQIEAELFEMVRQLPTREEVANLLIDISKMGLASGLEFRLFRPLPAVPKEFYSELPINIEVVGRYDELGLFVSGLAALPRIVTVHDINILPLEASAAAPRDKAAQPKTDDLLMTAMIRTYNEIQEAAPAAKPATRPATQKAQR